MANEITKSNERLANEIKYHDRTRDTIASYLPKNVIDLDKFIDLCRQALLDPDRELHTATYDSLRKSIYFAAHSGLILVGEFNQADLIKRGRDKKDEKLSVCRCEINARGLRDLAFRTGLVTSLQARSIYEGDTFDCDFGRPLPITHKFNFDKPKGSLIGAYGLMTLATGTVVAELMRLEDMKAMQDERLKSVPANSKTTSPWSTHFESMIEKTLTKKMCRKIPNMGLDSGLLSVLAQDNEETIEAVQQPQHSSVMDYIRDGILPHLSEDENPTTLKIDANNANNAALLPQPPMRLDRKGGDIEEDSLD